MTYLINGVEFTEGCFVAYVIGGIGANEDQKEIMSELIGGSARYISGDLFSVAFAKKGMM